MFDPTQIDWQPTRHPGIFVNILRHDDQTGDATVLIRMQAGCGYPAHRHVGIEEVFIIQGGYRDANGLRRAGEYFVNDAGSTHHPIALEGDDCVLLAFAHAGIEIV
jgi:anti-sigma factor ChrR (cupin superfamily)